MTDVIVWEILSYVLGAPREKQIIKLNEQRPWCSQSSKVCPWLGFQKSFPGSVCQRGESLIHLCMLENTVSQRKKKSPILDLKFRPTF